MPSRWRAAVGVGDDPAPVVAVAQAWRSTECRATAPPPEDPLAAALAGALSGDEEAFRVLYRSTQPILLRYLYVLVGSDAADVASEAWLQICRDLQRFSGDIHGFRAWSMTVARNRAMDHVRRMRRRPETVHDEHYLTSLAASVDTATEVIEGNATAEVLRLVRSLPRIRPRRCCCGRLSGSTSRPRRRFSGSVPAPFVLPLIVGSGVWPK